MILTDENMIKELKEANIDVMLPIISRPPDKTTSYYDYTKSHRHKLLIRDLLQENFEDDDISEGKIKEKYN